MQRSSLALIAFAQLLPLAAGCGDDTDAVWQEGYDEGYAAGKDEVDDLAATVAELATALEAMQAEVAANGAADLEQQAEIDDIQADYLTSADLAGFATEAWVQEQAYLTDAALEGYTTMDWVSSQGYLTSTDLLNYSTMDWVVGLGFTSGFDLELVDGRVTAIEADYLTSDDLVGLATESWVTGLGYALDADFDLVEGRVDDLEDELGALDLSSYVQLIDTDTTIAVTTSTELSEAIADLDGCLIAADATVTIALAAGTYAFTSPLYFSHPSGDRVLIQGADASTTILYFPSSDGLVVEGGATLGYVSDVTVMGADASGQDGVVVEVGSALGLGVVTVRNFGQYCVLADTHSLIMADEGLVVSDCGSFGVLAAWTSFVAASGADVSRCPAGIGSFYGSSVKADSASASNGGVGFYASSDGYLYAYYGVATNNTSVGFASQTQSAMEARYSSSSGSSYAYLSGYSGHLDANYATAVSSTTADFRTVSNSFIMAASAAGSTTSTANNDTTDWVYGK